MGKVRNKAQYGGILLQPIKYPPFYGVSRRYLKAFDFKTDDEVVTFQERLRSEVDRQMEEKWDALCAHYGIDPSSAHKWHELVLALVLNHEPEFLKPTIRLDALLEQLSPGCRLRRECIEHWLIIAFILATKHVPGFSEASHPRQRTTFSNDDLEFITLGLGDLAEWINRDRSPALAGTAIVEPMLALIYPDRRSDKELVCTLGSKNAAKLRVILNSASRQGRAKGDDALSRKAMKQLLVDVVTAREAVVAGRGKPIQFQLLYGVMPNLRQKVNIIRQHAGLPDLE